MPIKRAPQMVENNAPVLTGDHRSDGISIFGAQLGSARLGHSMHLDAWILVFRSCCLVDRAGEV
jgi:hypothetical protein